MLKYKQEILIVVHPSMNDVVRNAVRIQIWYITFRSGVQVVMTFPFILSKYYHAIKPHNSRKIHYYKLYDVWQRRYLISIKTFSS